ncbi:restriction endonuclease subunit S [Campylobacter hyointestinalis subsp. lawsonii]|nr:restriction endonuclease subunit S [Campylobacter hyointestinalis subsp. lawsonii]
MKVVFLMSNKNIEFKDSGIPWIGQIPKHWEVIRNKYILSGLYSGGTPTSGTAKFYTDEDYGIPFVSIGDMSKKEFIESTKTKITKLGILDKNLKILPKNTILYSIYATIGEVAELKCSATISQALLALFVKNSYNKQFYKYNLKAMKDYIFFESSGTTQFNLNAKKVLNFSFVLPPLNEQKEIAEFLDKKCEIIDKRLSNLERKIKSLKEYKKSLISECVTKGLNPKILKFKDSGIPWIGQIPKHWEIKKGKYIFTNPQKPVLETDEVITCFRDGEVTLRSKRREDGFTISLKEIGYQGIDAGDLVIHGMDGFAGAIGISEYRGKCSPVLNILETKNSKKFYMYFLRSMAYNGVFEALSTGIRVRTCDTNWAKIKNIVYLVPPLNEQKEIAEFLDKKCEKIDRLNENYTKQIAALKEYKKSLIYECVTGKKEI